MEHPIWMLLPWGVFALAAGVKFWRFGRLLQARRQRRWMSSDQFRRSLERIWQLDPPPR